MEASRGTVDAMVVSFIVESKSERCMSMYSLVNISLGDTRVLGGHSFVISEFMQMLNPPSKSSMTASKTPPRTMSNASLNIMKYITVSINAKMNWLKKDDEF